MAGGSQALFAILVFISCACPVVIAIFVSRRKFPSIRYANPSQAAASSACAALLSLGSSIMLVCQERVACGTFNVFLYVLTTFTLFSIVLTQMTLIMTFRLTQELALHHGDNSDAVKSQSLATISKFRRFLRPRVLVTMWIVGSIVWLLPPLAAVDSESMRQMQALSVADCVNMPLNMPLNVVLLTEVGLFIVAFTALSLLLSKVMDNFGLRHHFQVMSRLLGLLLLINVLALVYHSTPWVITYKIRFVVLPVAGWVVVACQVGWPLARSWTERPVRATNVTGRSFNAGSSAALEDFLATEEGYLAFSAFARLEFSLENVVAWKAAYDFKKNGGGDAQKIYTEFMRPGAPMETNIPDALRQHYQKIFEHDRCKSKANALDAAIAHDPNVFDPFREAMLKLMTLDTLPRFQKHALGQQWTRFLVEQTHEEVHANFMMSLSQREIDHVPMERSQAYLFPAVDEE